MPSSKRFDGRIQWSPLSSSTECRNGPLTSHEWSRLFMAANEDAHDRNQSHSLFSGRLIPMEGFINAISMRIRGLFILEDRVNVPLCPLFTIRWVFLSIQTILLSGDFPDVLARQTPMGHSSGESYSPEAHLFSCERTQIVNLSTSNVESCSCPRSPHSVVRTTAFLCFIHFKNRLALADFLVKLREEIVSNTHIFDPGSQDASSVQDSVLLQSLKMWIFSRSVTGMHYCRNWYLSCQPFLHIESIAYQAQAVPLSCTLFFTRQTVINFYTFYSLRGYAFFWNCMLTNGRSSDILHPHRDIHELRHFVDRKFAV